GRVGGAAAGGRARNRGLPKLAELVGQFKRQPFRRLFPYPRDRCEQRDVPLLHCPSATLHPQRRHQGDRDPRPHAAHADQSLEEAPPGVVVKAVERPAVLPHHELGREAHRLAQRGQALHHAQRHDDLVAHAARGLDHHAIGLLRGEPTRDVRNHDRRMCVSATATPSAASAGLGACLSRSSRATTLPTCALAAPPAPATSFLMVAGAYSAIATPACSAARSTTPRAWPSTSVVCTFLW